MVSGTLVLLFYMSLILRPTYVCSFDAGKSRKKEKQV